MVDWLVNYTRWVSLCMARCGFLRNPLSFNRHLFGFFQSFHPFDLRWYSTYLISQSMVNKVCFSVIV
ncbi:hypothetical protein L1987_35318 [Smallanthus sonchifolius]|uniref:Uncharacterized protein n=1 Tax=Smallanthus sonchifolius TaxID=185202 RepID=A0ACB9HWQ9_9ASTR|nr:hypothetical protein L1987_35318 [Smallanthus sonchifolius]